ncbi:MAG: uracil-DNA glycosylase [Thermoplasmata archaeon]
MPSQVDRRESRPPRSAFPAGRARRPTEPDAWGQLQHEIESCTRCPLHATRTQVVVYRGSRRPRIVFVGEAPGAEEDRLGVPFVGRSGRRLDAALAAIGLPADAIGILNLIKCRPPENRFHPLAARTCRPFLDRQLALLRPTVLVTLGAHALAAIDPAAPRILQCAGEPRRVDGRDVFPMIHPAAALRSTRMAHRWKTDFDRLGNWLPSVGRETARESL